MNLVHFILLGLLGLLNLSLAAVPGQLVDVATGNDGGHDLDLAVGNDLVARQGFPQDLLLTWELKCAVDPAKTEPAPGKKKGFIKDDWCRRYFICKLDGKEPRDTSCASFRPLTQDDLGKKDYNPDWRWPKPFTKQSENRKW